MRAFLAFFLAFMTFCNIAYAAQQKPKVVVSIAPQKWMVQKIAGDLVEVSVMVKEGADPHTYEPTMQQMRDLGGSIAYFTIGLPFEDAWLPRMKDSLTKTEVVSLIKGIQRLPNPTPVELDHDHVTVVAKSEDLEKVLAHAGHDHGQYDPHVWLSPPLVKTMVPVILKTLVKALPEHSAFLQKNAAATIQELDDLDFELAQQINTIEESKRIFLTFHPAWQYFAKNYQAEEISIELEGKEPGVQGMKDIIQLAQQKNIKTIFIEPQFPKAAAIAIAKSLGAEVISINPLSENLPNALRLFTKELVKSWSEQ